MTSVWSPTPPSPSLHRAADNVPQPTCIQRTICGMQKAGRNMPHTTSSARETDASPSPRTMHHVAHDARHDNTQRTPRHVAHNRQHKHTRAACDGMTTSAALGRESRRHSCGRRAQSRRPCASGDDPSPHNRRTRRRTRAHARARARARTHRGLARQRRTSPPTHRTRSVPNHPCRPAMAFEPTRRSLPENRLEH
jgi:hypothetical protein